MVREYGKKTVPAGMVGTEKKELNRGLCEEAEEYAGSHSRTDHTGNVGTHGVHEQVVAGIVFETEVVGDTCGHRHSRNAGVADERVDLLVFRKHEVEELDEENTRRRSDNESHEAEEEDEHCLRCEELRSLSRRTYSHAEKYSHDIGEGIRGSLGKTCGYTALAEKIAEEKHAEQRNTGGNHEAGEDHAHDGEDDLLALSDGTSGTHLDQALVLGGEEAHDRGLDHGHESHVAISRNGDGTHEVGGELRRKEDSCRTVGTADDGDSASLVGCETKSESYDVGTKDTELCGSTDEHQLGIGDEGREVGHGTDAKEDQRGIPAGAHAIVKDIEYGTLFVDTDFKTGFGVERYVADEHTEADGHEKHRLEVLLDGKPDEEQAYRQHNKVLPCGVVESCQMPELREVAYKEITE